MLTLHCFFFLLNIMLIFIVRCRQRIYQDKRSISTYNIKLSLVQSKSKCRIHSTAFNRAIYVSLSSSVAWADSSKYWFYGPKTGKKKTIKHKYWFYHWTPGLIYWYEAEIGKILQVKQTHPALTRFFQQSKDAQYEDRN